MDKSKFNNLSAMIIVDAIATNLHLQTAETMRANG